jgi:hypothetical protein
MPKAVIPVMIRVVTNLVVAILAAMILVIAQTATILDVSLHAMTLEAAMTPHGTLVGMNLAGMLGTIHLVIPKVAVATIVVTAMIEQVVALDRGVIEIVILLSIRRKGHLETTITIPIVRTDLDNNPPALAMSSKVSIEVFHHNRFKKIPWISWLS